MVRPPSPIATPRPPSAASAWWARRRSTISADLTVHGLAYLGVALVFTGVLGFVIFAFGDVGAAWRPVAELALPLACFGSAAFLHRRGAPFVSAALEFLGGLLLPIVAVASLADGADVPPDLDGASLVVTLMAIALVLAGAYALAVRRRPLSPLGYLVAPMVWLAVASFGLALAPVVVSGSDVSRPFSLQWALVAAAVAATLGLCRRHPGAPIARASMVAAIPGAAFAALMTVLAAPRSGWPAGAMMLAGASTLVSIELLAPRLRASAVTVLQAVTVVGTAATLGPELGGTWAAAAAAIGLLALAEWQARRRADPTSLAVLSLGSAGAAALCVAQPWPTVAVAGTALAWAAARRYRPLAGLPHAVPIAGLFVFPVMAATGLVRLIPLDASLVVIGGCVVAIALAVRVTAARRDGVMAVWVPVAAGAVAAYSAADTTGRPWLGAVAAGLAAIAFALAPRWPCLRVWTVAAAAGVAGGWVAHAVDAELGAAAVGAALGGTALVGLSFLRRVPVFGHLGLVGHAATAAALVAALADGAASNAATAPWVGAVTVTLGLVALGWVAVTVVGETWGCAVRDLIIRVGAGSTGAQDVYPPVSEAEPGQLGAGLPPGLALVATTAFVPAVLVATGALGRSDPWLAVAAGGVTVVAALLARSLPERRPLLAGVWSFLGVWLTAALALATWADPWPAVAGSVAVVVAVVAVGPGLRRPSMIWLGWVASAAVASAGAWAAGVSGDESTLVLFSWASAAAVGGLALDDAMCGRRRPGEWVRRAELRPGVVLGSAVAPFAFLPVYGLGRTTSGWWSLIAAGVAFVVAAQLRRGGLSALGWVLVSAAYLALAPWDPVTLPWTIVPVVAMLSAAAELAHRFVPPPPPSDVPPRPDLPPPPGASSQARALTPAETRWDLPPFVVAHGLAASALVAALVNGWVPATWIATGAIGLFVAGRLRAWPWAVGGVALVLVGAGVAGPGWLTLAMAVTSVSAVVGAIRSKGAVRPPLQVVGAVAAGGSWCSLVWWLGWDLEQAVVATALASAGVSSVLAVATRWARLGLDWLATWVALPVVGLAFAAVELGSPEVPRSPARFVVAAALAVASASVALLASPTGQDWLRESSVLLLVAAGALAGNAAGLSSTAWVVLSAIVAVVAMVVGLVLHLTDRAPAWRRPTLLLAGSATGVALAVSVVELPDRPLLVAALLVAGVELSALGLVTRRAGWLVASTATLLSAWLVFASQALTGDPQWFTVPSGLAVLVMVAFVRWDRRRSEADLDPAAPAIVGLDLLGMALVVGSALVQTLLDTPAFGLLAIALGLGLVAFGVLSRVRRRLYFGAATVALALVLIVMPPLVGLVDEIRGWVPWALLAAVGMVALLVAAFLEQGRRFVRRRVQRFSELTEGWE